MDPRAQFVLTMLADTGFVVLVGAGMIVGGYFSYKHLRRNDETEDD